MISSGEKQHTTLAAPVAATACPIAPGDVMVGRYTVELLLGQGTFAWVFSAIDSAAAYPRRVAVKVLRPERAQIPKTRRRFEERELALLHRVARAGPVRNVVQVLEPLLGTHRDLPFIVLELIDGPCLRDRINDGRPFAEAEAARIAHGIACGLAALHAADVVHRDLKPANILLRGGIEPVIVDLGIATAPEVAAELTATGKAPMTPRYAAPEQLAGKSAKSPCDVYAFGVILEEMAAGSRLDAIARSCLVRDPVQRPSAHGLVDALRPLLRVDPGEHRWSSILRALGLLALEAVSLGASDQSFSNVKSPHWTPAALMQICRNEHTSTRLANGDVLIVGGYDLSARSFVSAAERYDPTQEHWTFAGTIPPRKLHAATLLPSGEVLVMGGIGPDGWLADAARYTPTSNTWRSAAPMGAARARFTSTWLPAANQVLVAGGSDSRGFPQAGVERYDPKSDRWTAAAPMSVARAAHVALWIPSLERVMILGGSGEGGVSQAGLELYDPMANRWTPGAPMSVGRDYFTVTLLSDGRVLITGGMRRGTILASAEIYDPREDRWRGAASMHSARHKHAATLLDDGRVLISGGATSVEAEIYDPTLNRWAPGGLLGGSPNKPLENHTMMRLTDGRVLMTGRRAADVCICSLFDPGVHEPRSNSRWTPASPMYAERNSHVMALLPDRRVLVVGVPYSTSVNLAEVYDPQVNAWEHPIPMTASPPGRFAPAVTLMLGTTEVLITGGGHAEGNHSSTERYDPVRNILMPASSMRAYRREHTATLLQNGEILITGGYGAGIHATTERYDPAKDAWTTGAPMLMARTQHAAVTLRDGRVLIAGGVLGSKKLTDSSELYTPATDTWTQGMPLTSPRSRATAMLLQDGRVLLAGGYGDAGSEIGAEIYDPSIGRWQVAAPMRTPRRSYAAVMLSNGKVLMAGGCQGESTYLDTVEIYDPTRNAWSDGPSMGTARCEPAAILLSDGRVFVTGGLGDGRQVLSSAEIYTSE